MRSYVEPGGLDDISYSSSLYLCIHYLVHAGDEGTCKGREMLPLCVGWTR